MFRKLNFNSQLSIWLLLISLLLQTTVLTFSPSISPNAKNSFTGSYSVDTSTYHNSPSDNISRILAVTITFPFVLQNQTVKVATNFDNLQFDILNSKIWVYAFDQQITQTYIMVLITTYNPNMIKKIKVRYLVIAEIYASAINAVFQSGSSSPKRNITIDQPYSNSITGLSQIVNMTGGVSTYYAFKGFGIEGINNNFDLQLKIQQSTESSVNIYLSTGSETGIYVTSVQFIWITYNIAMANNSTLSRMQTQIITEPNQPYYNLQKILKFNTLIGLTSFVFNNGSNFNFQTTITPYIFSFGGVNQFQYLAFSILMIQTFSCSYKNPFYFNNVCYDVCPPRYGNDFTYWTCLACKYDCLTCFDTMYCQTCNSSDNRIMNYLTLRCQPMVGFYDNGYSDPYAFPCSTNCKVCLNQTFCWICLDGYYTTFTQCRSCQSPCLNCFQLDICQNCIGGYYLHNDSCLKCSSPCLNCSSRYKCLSCINRYYFSNNYCYKCMQPCMNCESLSSCKSCIGGYYLSQNQCLQCQQPCIFCNQIQQCKSCIDGYYLISQNNSCIKCRVQCVSCISNTKCLSCIEGYIFDYFSNKCFAEQKLISPITTLIAVIVGSFAGLIVLLSIIHCIGKRLKRRQVVMIYSEEGSMVIVDALKINEWTEIVGEGSVINQIQECSICLNNKNLVKLSCSHSFHGKCVIDWTNNQINKKIDINCPTCRRNLHGQLLVLCEKCRKRYKFVNIDDFIKQYYKNNSVCDYC